MLGKIFTFVAAVFLAVGLAAPVKAELQAFGGTVEVETDLGPFDFPLWYRDAKSLMLQACLDNPDFCLQELEEVGEGEEPVLEGLEFIYWVAETQIAYPQVPGSSDAGRARFIFALEGFVEEDLLVSPDPIQGVFNAVIIRLRGLQPLSFYTIFHPFATDGIVAQSDERGRLDFEDPTLHPEGTAEELFAIALEGPNQHFLYSDTLLPIEETLDSGTFYIGNPTLEDGHTVFGSPFGRNFVRVEGPGLPGGFIESDRFFVAGQIFFNEGQNLPPLANVDVLAAKPGESVRIDVLANDMMQGDVPINPTSLEKQGAINVAPGNGSVETVRELDKVLLNYTAPTTPGVQSLDYTVETFTGMSDTADIVAFVEDLQIAKAEYRARTGRWTIEGTSTFRDLVAHFTEGELNKRAYVTVQTGAQEMPPVTSAASGDFAAIFTDGVVDAFDYQMEVQVPPGVIFTQAHIHIGEAGVNGSIIFFLCTNLPNAPAGTTVPLCENIDGVISVSGTLTANELQARPAQGINTFADAVEAIQNGRTYVNTHSAAFPGGEIRGQIGRNVISLNAGENGPAIGAAEVQEGGHWSFDGKSIGSPGEAPHVIHVESGVGITETADLRLR